jgi:hypothetical protein
LNLLSADKGIPIPGIELVGFLPGVAPHARKLRSGLMNLAY